MTTTNDNIDFEDNLRQILSPGPVPGGADPDSGDEATAVAGRGEAIRPSTRVLLETASRIEAEQKALFWFKLLRPIAFVALVASLAFFVYRITTLGN